MSKIQIHVWGKKSRYGNTPDYTIVCDTSIFTDLVDALKEIAEAIVEKKKDNTND
jgi:hypothetical protein